MKLIKKLKTWSDTLYVKKVLKPIYLPILHKTKYLYKNRVFKNQGIATLFAAKQALDNCGTFFWLDFGTLLGVVRDGELISHDSDVDIAVRLDEYTEEIAKSLNKFGFTKKYEISIDNGKYGLEESYLYRGVSLDIFYYSSTDKNMYCHLFPLDNKNNHIIRELYIGKRGFTTIPFKGKTFNIPASPIERLKETYGENYHIPDKDWYTPDRALNSKIINKSINIKRYE